MKIINCKPGNPDRGTPLFETFIKNYGLWVDFNRLHRQQNKSSEPIPKIIFGLDQPGINCYNAKDVSNIVNDTNQVIFIDNITEGINFKIYLRHYPREKYYIIFSNGHWDYDYHDLPFWYKQVNYRYFLLEMTYTHLSHNRFQFYIPKIYDFSYPKSYSFISTAGSPRLEKDGFVYTLKKNIKHDNFVLRYNGIDLGQPYDDKLVSLLNGTFNSSKNLPGAEKYFYTLSQTIPLDLYNQGYFNLLVEGDIDYEHQFDLTEKTVKTLITGMPFVIVASPYFLKELKKLGFKTYESLWDESYDSIVDYDMRMLAIVKLVNNLVNYDWEGNKNKLQDIANHNRSNFFNINKLVDEQFKSLEIALDSLPVDMSPYMVEPPVWH